LKITYGEEKLSLPDQIPREWLNTLLKSILPLRYSANFIFARPG